MGYERILQEVYEQMKITFGYHTTHDLTIPDYEENFPLGGSETAMLRLAKALRLRGHEVECVPVNKQPKCDVFIALRDFRVFHRGEFPGKQNYLWCQDDIDQPMVSQLRDPVVANWVYPNINGVFTISNYQQKRWVQGLNLPVEKAILTTNGISYDKFEPYYPTTPRAYYSSTPFRGLEILAKSWKRIRKEVPNAELIVCSSMKVYNTIDSREEEDIFTFLNSMPGVRSIGSVEQRTLREFSQGSSVLAYPCNFPETSCITAMEAMASGCTVVSTNLGAMPETAWGNPLVTPQGLWQTVWEEEVIKALSTDMTDLRHRNYEIAKYYDWARVAEQWERIFLNA